MKNVLILVSLEVIFLITILVLLPGLAIRNRLGNTNFDSVKILPITKEEPIDFSFNAKYAHLSSLSLELKNPNLANHDLFDVTITNKQNQVLQSLSFSGSNVGDPSRLDLKFPPANNFAGDEIRVKISAVTDNHNQLFYPCNDKSVPQYLTSYKLVTLKDSIVFAFFHIKSKISLIDPSSLMIYFLANIVLHIYLIHLFPSKK